MTSIINFLIDFLVKVFKLSLSFQFDLFGYKVSVLSLQLACLVLIIFVSFFRNETPSIVRYGKHQFNRSENKKDKSSDYTPKHERKGYVPKHAEK